MRGSLQTAAGGPVSAAMIEVRTGDFSTDEAIARVKSPRIGGIVVYIGTVRSFSKEKETESLEYDIAAETIFQRLEQIERESRDKFDIDDMVIVHRIGTLKVCDNILLIAVAAPHREAAFAACQYIISSVRNAHALWQKETAKGAKWN